LHTTSYAPPPPNSFFSFVLVNEPKLLPKLASLQSNFWLNFDQYYFSIICERNLIGFFIKVIVIY
jgi:hypothetical protein